MSEIEDVKVIYDRKMQCPKVECEGTDFEILTTKHNNYLCFKCKTCDSIVDLKYDSFMNIAENFRLVLMEIDNSVEFLVG